MESVTRQFPLMFHGKRKVLESEFFKDIVESQKLHKKPVYDYSSQESIYCDVMYDLDEPLQKPELDEIVECIGNAAGNDSVRCAISLVQNIPYDEEYVKNPVQRYPYEVLYGNKGVCHDKSILLIYFLRALGYATAYVFFDEKPYCHAQAAVLRVSGYMAIEATQPSRMMKPKGMIVPISEGRSLYC